MKTAFVLGGSGHIGNAIVRALLDRGYRVTAGRRGRADARNLAGLAVAHACGDAGDPAWLDAAIADHELVVDAAAPYPVAIGDPGRAAAAAAGRARAIVDAATRRGADLLHVGAFVTEIATDVVGRRRGPGAGGGLAERLHPYFAAKRAGQEVFVAAARAGAAVTIVNPTLCLGPWDGKPRGDCLIPRLVAGDLPGVVEHLVNVVDVRDVAACAVAAVEQRHGEPIVVAGHNVDLRELGGLVAELAGRPAPRWHLPLPLALASAWTMELSAAAIGAPSPRALLPLLLVARHVPLTPSATQRALGGTPRGLMVTLRDALSWYARIGYC